MRTLTKEMQAKITPDLAIELLKNGNKRFLDNLRFNRDLKKQAEESQDGQFPFATILSCIDSRTSSELIFDQGIGDIFNIRIAGNIINEDILGSMEFACKVAGTKAILVLGHSNCGAVKGACDHVELGNLTNLLRKIQPAIDQETTETVRNSSNLKFVEKVTFLNVNEAIKQIMKRSEIISEMVNKGQIKIIGGIHDLATGEVRFLD